MNSHEFLQSLEQLPSSSWQAITRGQALLLIDDARLELGTANLTNVIIPAISDPNLEPTELRMQTLAQASQLLDEYYRTHPLTPHGFKSQVECLLEQLGAAAFAALPGRLPDYTLFVETGTVIAEPRQSPRHPYGAYCEITRPSTDSALIKQVKKWLDSGEAYERYLSMNVCRYNC
ncbi:MAG: hypothetical protein PVG22_13915 [Chromatiales bacterium]|jgi:hypothetical protein